MGKARFVRAGVVSAWLGLAACSGGHGTLPPLGVSAPTAAPGAAAFVTLTLSVPAEAAAVRHRDYVSAATKSAAIAVSAGGSSAGSPAVLNCSSGQTCTTTIPAPVGNDVFTVTAYAATGASGAKLGIGTATQTVVAGSANDVRVTLNGVVNSVVLALTSPKTVPAGSAATVTVSLDALDAAGDTIVAPGGYVDTTGAPMTISVAKVDYGNGEGATTLVSPSPNPVATGSGTSFTYTYNGSDLDETAFTTTTSKTIAGSEGSAIVNYTPTFIKKFADASGADSNFIATGPDGNLWFTDFGTGQIGSLVPATGAITHYSIPTSLTNGSAEPEAIVAGPNSSMYFAEFNSNAIGSISTTTAAVTGSATPVIEIPLTTTNANPRGIAYDTACSPNLWFTEFNGDKIGTLSSTTMTVTEYDVPTASAQPDQIACGPDGNFWFTEFGGNKIGRITPAGTITEFALPNPSAAHGPIGIAAGADGSMWFAESFGNAIGKIATPKSKPAAATGSVVEYPLPAAPANPETASLLPSIIAAAPDGDLFFSEFNSESQTTNAAIGRITTAAGAVPGSSDGIVASYPLDATSNMPYGITTGPDGHIWYVDMGAGAIGYVIY